MFSLSGEFFTPPGVDQEQRASLGPSLGVDAKAIDTRGERSEAIVEGIGTNVGTATSPENGKLRARSGTSEKEERTGSQ